TCNDAQSRRYGSDQRRVRGRASGGSQSLRSLPQRSNAMDETVSAVETVAVPPGTDRSTYVIALSSVAAIGGFLFGFDSGVINGTVDALALTFGPRAATTGFAVASVLVGCAIGAFVAGTIADRRGRRPTMLLTAELFLVSAIATGLSGSAGFFIVSR